MPLIPLWWARELAMVISMRNLALAQADLQTIHAEIKNEKVKAEQEKRNLLQKVAKMEEDRQAKEVELKKEIEDQGIMCGWNKNCFCVDLLYRHRRIEKWLHWCSIKGGVQNFDLLLQTRRHRHLVPVLCLMFSMQHHQLAWMSTSSIWIKVAANSKILQWLAFHRQTWAILNPWMSLQLTLRGHQAQAPRPMWLATMLTRIRWWQMLLLIP